MCRFVEIQPALMFLMFLHSVISVRCPITAFLLLMLALISVSFPLLQWSRWEPVIRIDHLLPDVFSSLWLNREIYLLGCSQCQLWKFEVHIVDVKLSKFPPPFFFSIKNTCLLSGSKKSLACLHIFPFIRTLTGVNFITHPPGCCSAGCGSFYR